MTIHPHHPQYTPRTPPVSLWLVQVWFFGFWFGLSKLTLKHHLFERVLGKKNRTQSFAVQDIRASLTPSISQASPRIHTACTPSVLFQVQPETTKKKASWHKLSPALQHRYLPLAFCQLPMVSGLIIWTRRRRGGGGGGNITLSLNASTCFVLSLGRHTVIRVKRKHRWHCTCFWKCLASLGFK